VWFDSYYDHLRMRHIASEVRRLQPDFICLQEVNAQLLLMLGPLLEQLGYCTQSALRHSYGEMLWWRTSTICCVLFMQEAFQDSMQGRQLHIMRCLIRGEPFAIATVHLESESKNSSTRLKQLGVALQRLRGLAVPFILAGDTNFGKKDDAMISADKIMAGVVDGETAAR
jgi:endonuclease/exonuclease/phosphatase family metal-dependent hydrolase